MDVLPDGLLDYPDEVLETLDIVIASLHVGLQQDRDTTTRRLLNAIQNPHVDLIGHPRSFWRAFQQPVEADMDVVLAAAQEHDTALEINANPERLDLDGPLARRATEMGIKLAINTDAHYPAMLDILEYGVYTARRGWVTAESVLNTWPLDKLRRWLHTRET
jgi:DNA polymerase (family 10)